jgi:hypothetical protein
MKESLFLLILTSSWLLAGCRPASIAAETFTPAPTSMVTATQPAETEVTAIARPDLTAPIPPSEAVTVQPSGTPTIIGTIVALSQPRTFSSQLSPDGKWQAEVVIYDCIPVGNGDENAYEQLKLVQVGSDHAVLADSQLQYCGGLGAFGLAGLFWSPNSHYFYYTNAREGYPDGFCGSWSPPFLRIDVSNPVPEYLGGGSPSKDGTMLATWQQHDLVLWDTNGKEIARIPAFSSDTEIGPVTWSPDNRSLVYLLGDLSCTLSGISYLIRVDMPERQQILLLQSESPSFSKVTWDDPDFLILSDENGDKWRYTFSNNELQPSP